MKWRRSSPATPFPPVPPLKGRAPSTGLGVAIQPASLALQPAKGRVSLSAALLFPLHWVGKHSGHFEVLFPPLGQCTWARVLCALFMQ